MDDRSLSVYQLFHMARGFLLLFWGIILEVLFFFHIVDFNFAFTFPVPSYLLGVLVIYTGLIFLYLVGPVSPHWKKLIHSSLVVATLHIYFVPFVYWWLKLQFNNFFLANVFALLFCSLWLLILVNRLAEEAADVVCNQDLKYEASAAGWGVILLLMVPVIIFLGLCGLNIIRNQTVLYIEVFILLQEIPKWLLFILVIPIALSIGSAWKAHASCIRIIKHMSIKRDNNYD